MNEKKIDAVIGEVIKIACLAELAADEQVKRHALYDIYDAIASLIPVDHRKCEAQNENADFVQCVDDEQYKQPDVGIGMKKYLHISDNLQLFRFRGSEFTKFIGRTVAHDGEPPHCYEIKVFRFKPTGSGGQAEAYVDGNRIFSIVSQSNIHLIEKMAVSALKRWCKEHRRRGEMRKKKRNVPTVG